MAVPTQSNQRSSSLEQAGVPVLFSIKNVQPLIFAAQARATLSSESDTARSSTVETAGVSDNAQSKVTAPIAQAIPSAESNAPIAKARRSNWLSKAVTTGFVVMLIALVIRFSVPGSRNEGELASTGADGNQTEANSHVPEMIVGPEANASESLKTRVASRPAVGNDTFLGNDTKLDQSSLPASEVPALPPLLVSSEQSPGQHNTANVESESTLPFILGPVASDLPDQNGMQLGEFNIVNEAGSESTLANPEWNLGPVGGAPARTGKGMHADASQTATGSVPGGVQAIETLTPDKTLAEFMQLFRNATQTSPPQSPAFLYQPVSTGGAQSVAGQSTNGGSQYIPIFAGQSGVNDQSQNVEPPTGYKPLTIPAYEQSIPGQPLNRYQPIKQPQRTPQSDGAPASVPYQPLVNPEANAPTGTSFGYPPVQFPPG
ncbi:hypothetical protein SH449x_005280 [Pirellulaceae bacterium SH449]